MKTLGHSYTLKYIRLFHLLFQFTNQGLYVDVFNTLIMKRFSATRKQLGRPPSSELILCRKCHKKTKNKIVTIKLGLGSKARKHHEYRCIVCDSVKLII